MRTYRVNGKTYLVPVEVAKGFDAHMKILMGGIPKEFMVDDDATGTVKKRHVCATIKSVSFSATLAEWAKKNWKEYEQNA